MILRGKTSAKLVYALVVTSAYFLTAYWLKASFIPAAHFQSGPNVAGEKLLMYRPFTNIDDSKFGVAQERQGLFGNLSDSEDDDHRSPIELYEDDKPLGPAHSSRSDIAALGQGRFSHWRKNGTTLYWSSSDNSDPNTNGRAYWVVKPAVPKQQ
jgi:hypothetical protein